MGSGINKSATTANLGLGAINQQIAQSQSAARPKGQSHFAGGLKKEMQFVRDESKKSKTYLELLEQQNFVVNNISQHEEIIANITLAKSKAEQCINTLMSD